MFPYTTIVPIIVVLAPLALFVVLGLVEQGKRLICPNCGRVFDAPFVDRKFLNLGWTFPYFGQVECPKCGAKRLRRSYAKV